MIKIRFRKYLIFPSTQIKYALIFSSIIFFPLISFSLVVWPFFKNLLAARCDNEAFSILQNDFLFFYLGLLAFSTLVTFFAAILVTHRFLGPFYAVKRSLDIYREKKVASDIVIRKNDEIRPLINELNKFLKELESDAKADNAPDK